MVNEEVRINIKGHEYSVPFPTVGQFYRIEALKQSLSRGFYNSMVMSPTGTAQQALDMIDIEATLTVLVPDLIKDLKVNSFDELDVRDYTDIRDAYLKSVTPFFKEVQDILNGAVKD